MSKNFKEHLLSWYSTTQRDLPWKETRDPYKIWLSEIILQQTRVEQGRPYYLRFIERFPDVYALAHAPLEEVLKAWEGLGYYSRARNLHQAAQQILEQHEGRFPSAYNDILALKGVGPYTAAAIASFAFHLPHAVLDGNVYRVLSRYFGIDMPIDSHQGQKLFSALAQECLDTENPADYNQAIMDLGATVCTPLKANCAACPLQPECRAFNESRVYSLPVKSKKIIRQSRHFTFLVLISRNEIVIEQRNDQDIWKGLFQFPAIERQITEQDFNSGDFGFKLSGILSVKSSPAFRQLLTHREIAAVFYEVNTEEIWDLPAHCRKIPLDQIKNYAFPGIIREYLKQADWL